MNPNIKVLVTIMLGQIGRKSNQNFMTKKTTNFPIDLFCYIHYASLRLALTDVRIFLKPF